MINKVLAIYEGWYNTINSQSLPQEKKDIASNRGAICSTCDRMGKVRVLGILHEQGCTVCGCPFPQKLYSFREGNNCPLNKW